MEGNTDRPIKVIKEGYFLVPKSTLINDRRPKIIHRSMIISGSRINFLGFKKIIIKSLCTGPKRKGQIYFPNQLCRMS